MSDTPLDLAPIKARLEAATPGPWGLTHSPNERTRLWSDAEGYVDDVIALDPTTARGKPCADMEFIAAAPTDVAALVAEVERLRGEPSDAEIEAAAQALYEDGWDQAHHDERTYHREAAERALRAAREVLR